MLTKRIKWISLSTLTIFICFIFTCISYTNWSGEYSKSHPREKPPLRVLSIQINNNEREELFGQLKEFSKKYKFSYQLSLYKRQTLNDTFLVEIYGSNFHISAASQPTNTTDIDFYFTVDDPTHPPSQEFVEEVYSDLKVFIEKVPSTVIIQEK